MATISGIALVTGAGSGKRRLCSNTIAKFGRLDVAVNCAGVVGPPAISVDLDLEEANRVMKIDFRGTFLFSRAEIRAMTGNEPSHLGDVPGQRGAVVNIASNLAFMAKPGSRKLRILCVSD